MGSRMLLMCFGLWDRRFENMRLGESKRIGRMRAVHKMVSTQQLLLKK